MASRTCIRCQKPIQRYDKFHFVDKLPHYPELRGGDDSKVLHINCDDPISYYPPKSDDVVPAVGTNQFQGGKVATELPSERATQVVKERAAKQYGDPTPIATTAAYLWNNWLDTEIIHPSDVQMMMALHKVARERHAPQEDNLTDICGYINIYERVKEAT